MNAVKAIEPWQITKIWTISKALGMDKDDTHAMAGTDSLKELTAADANEVLARLQQMQGKYLPPVKAASTSLKQRTAVAGMATVGQQGKVWALMYELASLDTEPSSAALGDRLCGIIKKELDTTATPAKPFAWLDFKSCNKLIEVLKKYIANAKKKGGDCT